VLKQAVLTSLPSTKFAADNPKQKQMTEKLIEMIWKDLQPFSIVQDAGFRGLLNAAEPRYLIPTRKTLSKKVPELYKKVLERVKLDVKNADGLALTMDAWTSRANESYISYTAHYLTEDFSIKNYCMKVDNVDESHTAINLAQNLIDCVNEWTTAKQQEMKIFVVSDNAANIQAAITKVPQCIAVNCFYPV